MSASTQTTARRQDITLADPLDRLREEEDELADRGTIIKYSINTCTLSIKM